MLMDDIRDTPIVVLLADPIQEVIAIIFLSIFIW